MASLSSFISSFSTVMNLLGRALWLCGENGFDPSDYAFQVPSSHHACSIQFMGCVVFAVVIIHFPEGRQCLALIPCF